MRTLVISIKLCVRNPLMSCDSERILTKAILDRESLVSPKYVDEISSLRAFQAHIRTEHRGDLS